MSPFVIITAVPFGYLFFYLGLLALLLVGVAVLVAALVRRPRRPWLALAGAIGAAGALAVFRINAEADAALDYNPLIPADSALVGTWHGKRAELSLAADGTYRCSGGTACVRLGASGQWTRSGDDDIRFGSGPAAVLYRVVRYRGTLRLFEEVEDPDMWDGRFLFEQVAPAG